MATKAARSTPGAVAVELFPLRGTAGRGRSRSSAGDGGPEHAAADEVRIGRSVRGTPGRRASADVGTGQGAPTPFPWDRIWIVYAVVVANAIAFTGVTSFLPEMVVEQFGFSADDAGTAVGLLGGAFSVAQFMSSFALGFLSDRVGRKPLLLTGLAVPAVLLGLFGVSPSFGWALANRAVEGFTNSNISVAKAYLSDVITTQHRALAFGYLGACFSAARILSAAAAGALAEVFPKGNWLRFAFPCFLLAPPLAVVFMLVAACLPESAPAASSKARKRAAVHHVLGGGARRLSLVRVDTSSDDDDGDTAGMATAVVIGDASDSGSDNDADDLLARNRGRSRAQLLPASPGCASPAVPGGRASGGDTGVLSASATSTAFLSDAPAAEADVPLPPLALHQGLRVIFSDKPTVMVIILFCVNSFCNGGILIANILFMALPVAHLGLGMSPATIGVANSAFAVCALAFQAFAVKPILKRLGPMKVYRRIGALSLGLGTALLPVAAWPVAATHCVVNSHIVNTTVTAVMPHRQLIAVAGHGLARHLAAATASPVPAVELCGPDLSWLMWAITVAALGLQAIGFMTCLPMVHTFISNVGYPEIQGLTQGTATSLSSLLRAIGPMVTGVVFSAAAAHRQPFWANGMLACGYFLSFVASLFLDPATVEVQRTGAAPRPAKS